VKAPMQALLDELEAEFGEGKIFRPNRDIRFSADKSPYKTSIAATLSKGGYVQLSGAGLAAGRGMWHMASDQLERYRKAVDDERTGSELVQLCAGITKKSYEISAHDALKTAPKGYPKDHPRIELLRKKGLVTWKEWPVGAWLSTRKAKDRVVDLLHAAEPIERWLHEHVGDSTLPDPMHR
jgi:uncharacterized protein (TIGR02453 family)